MMVVMRFLQPRKKIKVVVEVVEEVEVEEGTRGRRENKPRKSTLTTSTLSRQKEDVNKKKRMRTCQGKQPSLSPLPSSSS